MQSDTQSVPVSKKRLWAGRIKGALRSFKDQNRITHSLKGSSGSSSRFRDLSKHSARNVNSSSVDLKRNSQPVSTSSIRPTKWRRAASVSGPSCKT